MDSKLSTEISRKLRWKDGMKNLNSKFSSLKHFLNTTRTWAESISMINIAMPTIHSKKWTWCLPETHSSCFIQRYCFFITKLHPDERKGTKDIVEEVCEYYIEKFENADRPKRKNRSAS